METNKQCNLSFTFLRSLQINMFKQLKLNNDKCDENLTKLGL